MLPRFGLFPVRSPLLGESRLISVPPGTEMFQFPGLAPASVSSPVTGLATGRVSPFGHPGITAHVQLPQAYRSLSRPSSPLDAKASTVCLIAFDLKFSCRVQPCDRAGTIGVDSSHPARSHPRTRKRAHVRQQANHPFVDCQRAGRIPQDPPKRSDAS